MAIKATGAEIILKALEDQGVDTLLVTLAALSYLFIMPFMSKMLLIII